MNHFQELQRIAKYLAGNRLKEDEIFGILEAYQMKVYTLGWNRGYRSRAWISERSKEAEIASGRKNQELDQDKLEDPILIDYNKVIKKGVMIPLANGDYKPVEYLCHGEEIIVDGQIKTAKIIKKIKDDYLITL